MLYPSSCCPMQRNAGVPQASLSQMTDGYPPAAPSSCQSIFSAMATSSQLSCKVDRWLAVLLILFAPPIPLIPSRLWTSPPSCFLAIAQGLSSPQHTSYVWPLHNLSRTRFFPHQQLPHSPPCVTQSSQLVKASNVFACGGPTCFWWKWGAAQRGTRV